jgi:hypothetical protein
MNKLKVIHNALCGCTENVLCEEAKRLWNKTTFGDRRIYSIHRCRALNIPYEEGNDMRSLNKNSEGKKLKLNEY